MMGATGAVGGQVVNTLLEMEQVKALTLLGRRPLSGITVEHIHQHNINIHDTATYHNLLPGHQIAICTLGVGQPSKTSKEDFYKIDHQAVYDFAVACKAAGVRHFELLASVGIDAGSASYYLRTKGELVEKIEALNFERFSVFQPSMILTPTNRYGFSQAVLLKVWPLLQPLLMGGLRKYRGVSVGLLGKAMAVNVVADKTGTEYLEWDDFQEIAEGGSV